MTTLTDEYQPDLFGPIRTEVRSDRLSHEDAFARFRRRNGWFMPRLAELAYEQQSIGRTVSVKALFEIIRAEGEAAKASWKLDNSWTSIAGRLLMEDYPKLKVRTRKRKWES